MSSYYNHRKCNTCNSDKSWNYCCKVHINNYISELENQVYESKYKNTTINNEIINLRSRAQFAVINLKYETMKATIVGFLAGYICLYITSWF